MPSPIFLSNEDIPTNALSRWTLLHKTNRWLGLTLIVRVICSFASTIQFSVSCVCSFSSWVGTQYPCFTATTAITCAFSTPPFHGKRTHRSVLEGPFVRRELKTRSRVRAELTVKKGPSGGSSALHPTFAPPTPSRPHYAQQV